MKRIVFGILLIATAVLIILSGVGVNMGFVSSLSVIDLLLSVVLIIFAVSVIVEGNLNLAPFPLVLLFFFIEDDIAEAMGRNGNLISNWLVLGCGVLVSLGISMITNPHKKTKNHIVGGCETKYIDCTNFKYYQYTIRMGSADIFFENSEQYTGGGLLDLTSRMSSVTIHVPTGWHIVSDIQSGMGAVQMPNVNYSDGPTLTITGHNKMGNVDIVYC